jgi:hypothetical protein
MFIYLYIYIYIYVHIYIYIYKHLIKEQISWYKAGTSPCKFFRIKFSNKFFNSKSLAIVNKILGNALYLWWCLLKVQQISCKNYTKYKKCELAKKVHIYNETLEIKQSSITLYKYNSNNIYIYMDICCIYIYIHIYTYIYMHKYRHMYLDW